MTPAMGIPGYIRGRETIQYGNRHTSELHKHRHFFYVKKSNTLCTGKMQPFALCSFLVVTGKGKAIPLQAWTGPEGSRSF